MATAIRSLTLIALLLGPVTLLLAGCASGPEGAPAAAAPGAAGGRGRVEDLLTVDCLLPPQIRQIGSSLTTLSKRRPVKTSARDCEIRGGEYTAFDRADYKS